MRTTLFAATTLAVASLGVPPAHALLISSASAPGLAVGACGATDGGSGSLSASCSGGAFSNLAITASGPPLVPAPDLSVTALTVTTAAGSFPTTLDVTVSSQGFAFAGGPVEAILTINNLIGDDAGPFTLTASTPVGSETHTFTASGTDHVGPVNLGAFTTDAAEFALTFSGGAQSVDATIEIVGVTPAPEPASLALMGVGLLGLGMIRLTRKSTGLNG